jgi:hypothetical protein
MQPGTDQPLSRALQVLYPEAKELSARYGCEMHVADPRFTLGVMLFKSPAPGVSHTGPYLQCIWPVVPEKGPILQCSQEPICRYPGLCRCSTRKLKSSLHNTGAECMRLTLGFPWEQCFQDPRPRTKSHPVPYWQCIWPVVLETGPILQCSREPICRYPGPCRCSTQKPKSSLHAMGVKCMRPTLGFPWEQCVQDPRSRTRSHPGPYSQCIWPVVPETSPILHCSKEPICRYPGPCRCSTRKPKSPLQAMGVKCMRPTLGFPWEQCFQDPPPGLEAILVHTGSASGVWYQKQARFYSAARNRSAVIQGLAGALRGRKRSH